MKVVHNWLKDYIGEKTPSAEEIEKLLTFHSFEIEGIEKVGEHEVIDVDVLPNRSSDCLCHRGIAREVATLMSVELEKDPLAQKIDLPSTSLITVDIENTEACPRFTASLITGITVKPSPQWLQDRLQALGQRPINNIVDATNYVMYAIGQPLHAYDADKFPQVDGKWQFEVRTAQAGETVSLIAEGGKSEERIVELEGTETLIVDKSSNTPIGLAGVKGGRYAGVDETTTKIIVEAANFNPSTTRKTARRLGIVIDASKRFENECSRELPPYAQRDIVELIIEIAGGAFEGFIDVYAQPQVSTEVAVSTQTTNALLGLTLATTEMTTILRRTGTVVRVDDDVMYCTGPFERTDLNIEEDFIEEIGRIYGYNHVASVVPEAVPLQEINARHYYSEQIRATLLRENFSEVITSSFRKKDQIKLQNALASDKAFLRSSLTKNLTEVLDKNAGFNDVLGVNDIRVFEIGTVFSKGEGSITEHTSLCLGVRTKVNGYNSKDDVLLAEMIAHVNDCLGTALIWNIEKGVAETNLSAVVETLPTPGAYDATEKSIDVQYQPFSLFPSTSRDIAMWTDGLTGKEAVEKVLNETAGELRVRTTFMDEFTKDGRTSLAFRLVFQAPDRTLTDEEVTPVMDTVYKTVAEHGWEAR